MANITPYITAIRTARYGEEVRGSIADALDAVNDQVEDDTASAGTYATNAATSASEAAASLAQFEAGLTELEQTEAAIETAESSRSSAEASRVAAEAARVSAENARASQATGYVTQAANYAEQARQHASSDNMTLSRSWAVGGTSYRPGEDTNNSQYWSNVSKEWADAAAAVVTEGGVGSFNGRTGTVAPQLGDYTSSLIGRGTGTVETALVGLETRFGGILSFTINANGRLVIVYDDGE